MTFDNKIKACKNAEELAEVLKEHMGDREIMRMSSCPSDSFGWSRDTHTRLEKIQRKGLMGKDIHIRKSYKFEVYDWEFVRD